MPRTTQGAVLGRALRLLPGGKGWPLNAPRPEPLQLLQDVPIPSGPTKRPISPGLAAWVARKRRERVGLPLRRCDREQVSEQMEDL
jgi:hypothetical protein